MVAISIFSLQRDGRKAIFPNPKPVSLIQCSEYIAFSGFSNKVIPVVKGFGGSKYFKLWFKLLVKQFSDSMLFLIL